MNCVNILKGAIRPQQLIQVRFGSYNLSRKRGRVEIFDENYDPAGRWNRQQLKEKQIELMKKVPWEMSAKYLESEEFQTAYRGMKVWIPYRSNFKGRVDLPPVMTRNRCIVDGFVVVGSPCPVCRDKYLLIHPKNVKLLDQFINPATDQVYPIAKIMLCEYTYEELVSAVEIARDRGYLQFRVPFRQFDYEDFYSQDLIKDLNLNDQYVEPNSLIKRASRIINPTNYPYSPTEIPM